MNDTTTPDLYVQSAQLLRSQLPAHISWMCICVLTFFATGFLLYAIASSTSLRAKSQDLILAVFVSDMLQSIIWGILGGKRLYLSINNFPEVSSQFVCMSWLTPTQLTNFSTNFLIVCISFDRLIAITLPVWYRVHNKKMKLALIGVTPPLAVAFALPGLFISSKTIINIACTASQSFPPMYDQLAAVFENGAFVLTVISGLLTCVMILRRYLKHRRQRSELSVFKREIELHIVSRLGALVVTFLISLGASSVFLAAVRDSGLSDARKAALGPSTGCLHLSRGLLDCTIYIGFCPEYRTACRKVVVRCCSFAAKISSISANASNNVNLVVRNSPNA